MLGLAANAKKRGDKAAALDWYEKAYAAADGPATRLQWGAGYVNALVDLSPQDAKRIETAASQVIGELEAKPDTFFGRNQKRLERWARNSTAWNKDNKHGDSVQRIRAQMTAVCAKLPAGDPARAPATARCSRPNRVRRDLRHDDAYQGTGSCHVSCARYQVHIGV